MPTVQQRLVFVVSARDESVSRVTRAITNALKRSARETEAQSKKMGTAFASAGRSIGRTAQGIERSILSVRNGLVAAAGAGGLGFFAREAFKFERGISEISTLIDDVDGQLGRFTTSIRTVAREFGQTQGNAIKAQYDIISGGFTDAGESAAVLEASAKLATAGVAELGPTAAVTVKTLKGFGLGADEAEHAADLLFLTVRRGITTIPELSQNFAVLGPQANLAGVSLEEVSAAMATLTAAGIPTREAVTALNRLISGMAAPTDEAGKALNDMGIRLTEVGESGREEILPLAEVLRQFEGLDLKTVSDFFPNVRAIKALGVLTENFSEFQRNFDEFTDVAQTAGTVNTAFEKIADTSAFTFSQMVSSLRDAAIEFGSGFIDEIAGGADTIIENFEEISRISRETGEAVGTALREAGNFLSEYRQELATLAGIYVALRAAALAWSAATSLTAAIRGARQLVRVTQEYIVTARAARAAAVGLRAGLAGIALAVGTMIAAPLGRYLGESASGADRLRFELESMNKELSKARVLLEADFARATGVARDAALDMARRGVAVLREELEVVNRETGEVIENADDLAAANASLGTRTRVVSAELISVADAAGEARRAIEDGVEPSADLVESMADLSAESRVSAEVLAALPPAVRDAFNETESEANIASQEVEQFSASIKRAREELAFLESTGRGDLSSVRTEIARLQNAIDSADRRTADAENRRAGLIREIAEGVRLVEEELEESARADERREKQLRTRRILRAKENEAARRRAAEELRRARRAATNDFVEATRTETEALVRGLRERLDAVKAFEAGAAAARARSEVASVVTLQVGDAAVSQVQDAIERASAAADDAAGKLGEDISNSIAEGVTQGDIAESFGPAIGEIASRFDEIIGKANQAAEDARFDLRAVFDGVTGGLIATSDLTQDEADAIFDDPFNSDNWADSAARAGRTVAELESEYGDVVSLARRVSGEIDQLNIAFVNAATAAERDASSAVRGLVEDLDELSSAEIRLLRIQLAGNGAVNDSADRFLEAAEAAAEAREAYAELGEAIEGFQRTLSDPDVGRITLRRLRDGLTSFGEVSASVFRSVIRRDLEGAGAALRDLRRRGVSELERLTGAIRAVSLETDEGRAAVDRLRGALRAAEGSLSDRSITQLLRLRREAEQIAEALEDAGANGGDIGAASSVARAAVREITDRVVGAAAQGARLMGRAISAAGTAAARTIRNAAGFFNNPLFFEQFLRDLGSLFPATINGISVVIDRLLDGIAEAIPAIGRAIIVSAPRIAEKLIEGVGELLKSLIAALPDVARAVLSSIVQLVDGLAETLREAIPGLSDALARILPSLAGAVGDILSSVASTLPSIVRGAITVITDALPRVVRQLLNALPSILSGIFDGLVELVSGLGPILEETIPRIIRNIGNTLPGIIKGVLNGAADVIQSLLTNVLPAIPRLLTDIVGGLLGALPDIIFAFVEGIVDAIPKVLLGLVDGLASAIPRLILAIIAELPALATAFLLELIAGLPRLVLELARGFVSGITSFFGIDGKFIAGFVDALSGVARTFRRAFRGVVDAFRAVGDAWRRTYNAFRNFFSNIWERVRTFFSSFVTRMREILTLGIGTANRPREERRGLGRAVGFFRDAGQAVGRIFGRAVGGVITPDMRPSFIPGPAGSPFPIMAHGGEVMLQRRAVNALGGPAAANQINRGILPASLRGRERESQPPVTNVNFVGGTIFARESAAVVDSMTYKNLRQGGKTGRLLRRRYGTLPGQR